MLSTAVESTLGCALVAAVRRLARSRPARPPPDARRAATVVVTETAEAERPCSRSESGAGQCGWRERLSGCGKEKVIERSIPYGEISAEPPSVKAVTITTG